MNDKSIRAVPWTLLGYAATKLFGFITTAVLAHLLLPADFGVVALALLAVGVITLFSDLGLSGVLIVEHTLDHRAKGTILTLMMLLSLVLGVIAVAGAFLAADLLRNPEVARVMPVMGGIIALDGVKWFYDALLRRELEFRKRFVSQLGTSLADGVVAITLAVLGAGVWSLVIGQIAGTALGTGLLVGLSPYRVRPAFDPAAAKRTLRVGRGFLVQGLTAFLAENADYVTVGRVLGSRSLGLYSMSYSLGEIPYNAVALPLAEVTFPSFARLREQGENVVRPFLAGLRTVALVGCPLGTLMSAAAAPFTLAILGTKWTGMIGALSILGLWAALRPVQSTLGWLLNSVSEAQILGNITVVVLLLLIPSLLIAAPRGGLTAVAWVMVGNVAVSLVALSVFAQRRAGVSVIQQWRALRSVAAGCVTSWIATRALADALVDLPPALNLVLSAAAGVAVYGITVLATEPALVWDAVGQVRRAIGRRPAGAME